MDGGSESRFCLGPAGPLLVAGGLLLLALLLFSLLSPELAAVLFMAVPALIALAILRRSHERLRRRR